MTAYELADAIEDWDSDGQWDTPAANMLRQQADRIAELEKQVAQQQDFIADWEKQSEPVAYRHWMVDEEFPEDSCWEYYDAPTGEDCKECYPLYTTPQTKPLRFPTMLRKMWTGAEVQKWLDEQVKGEQ